MTRDEAEKALQTVAALQERADGILTLDGREPCASPFGCLDIGDSKTEITFPEAVRPRWDDEMPTIESVHVRVSTRLLLMSDADFEAHCSAVREARQRAAEAKAEKDRQRNAVAAEKRKRQRDAEERATYERLKAKYEPPA